MIFQRCPGTTTAQRASLFEQRIGSRSQSGLKLEGGTAAGAVTPEVTALLLAIDLKQETHHQSPLPFEQDNSLKLVRIRIVREENDRAVVLMYDFQLVTMAATIA